MKRPIFCDSAESLIPHSRVDSRLLKFTCEQLTPPCEVNDDVGRGDGKLARTLSIIHL